MLPVTCNDEYILIKLSFVHILTSVFKHEHILDNISINIDIIHPIRCQPRHFRGLVCGSEEKQSFM